MALNHIWSQYDMSLDFGFKQLVALIIAASMAIPIITDQLAASC
jgi:hypothetical protein